MSRDHKRSTYIINKNFQYKFTGMAIFFVALIAAVYPLIFHQTFSSLIGNLQSQNLDVKNIADLKSKILNIHLVLHLIFTILIGIYFIIVSHRIAGPLYKLNMYLQNLKETGSIEKIKFRSNDYFKEIEVSYNEAMDKLIEEKNKDFTYLSEVSTFVSNLSVIVPEDKKPIIAEITKKLDEMQSKFKI